MTHNMRAEEEYSNVNDAMAKPGFPTTNSSYALRLQSMATQPAAKL